MAKTLGVDRVGADVLPEDKVAHVAEFKRDGGTVAMVGDGINDAPEVASADVGIAMSTGADIAMHSAEVTLVRGAPALVAAAIDISRLNYRKIQQNLFRALVYLVESRWRHWAG